MLGFLLGHGLIGALGSTILQYTGIPVGALAIFVDRVGPGPRPDRSGSPGGLPPRGLRLPHRRRPVVVRALKDSGKSRFRVLPTVVLITAKSAGLRKDALLRSA